jgi:hypothetical protein
VARLPLTFAELDISLRNVNSELTYFSSNNGKFKIKTGMIKKLEKFTEEVKNAGINRYWEHGNYPDEYQSMILKYIREGSIPHLALNKKVTLEHPASEKYPVGGASALTNGLKGINDYHFNWLGFEGNDMLAVVDLGEELEISQIRTDFLQDQNAWVFLPTEVHFYTSSDGLEFIKFKTLSPKEKPNVPGVFIESIVNKFPTIRCRFIKVEAVSMKQCPMWHKGAGGPSWIFCDEIIVN